MDRQKEIEQLQQAIESGFKTNQLLMKAINLAEKELTQLKATPEPKEPENYSEVVDAMPINDLMQDIISATNPEVIAFCKRLLIADYCGRREFEVNEENYTILYFQGRIKLDNVLTIKHAGENYFPTKEAAEKYLKICLNSNLL